MLRTVLLTLAALPAALQGQITPSRADSSAQDSTRRRAAPVVVSVRRTPVTIGGASALSASTEALELSPAPTLDQALRALPFVVVRQNSRGETELGIRGSDSRQPSVTYDGLPLGLAYDGRPDAGVIPLSAIGRIRLVRGLSSLLDGPNALGGTIALESEEPLPPNDVLRGQLALAMDQVGGQMVHATLGARHEITGGIASWRVGGGHRSRDGLTRARGLTDGSPDAALRANSDLSETDLFVSGRIDGANGAKAGLLVSGFEAQRGVPPETQLVAPRYWRTPALSRQLIALNARSATDSNRFGARFGEASLGLSLGAQTIDRFSDASYRTRLSRERGVDRALTARLAGHQELWDARTTMRGALTIADVRYVETQDGARALNFVQRLGSAAAEIEHRLRPGSFIAAGIAWDGASTPRSGDKPPLGSLDALGARLGLTHVDQRGIRWHASMSRRSRFPSLRELYAEALGRFVSNPALRPEWLEAAEVGFTAQRGALFAQSVLFHHRLHDAIVRSGVGDGRFQRVNRDELRSTGIELIAGWQWGRLSLESDWRFQHIRLSDPFASTGERRAEHQPEVAGGFDLGLKLPLGLEASGGSHFTGRQFCTSPEGGGQTTLDGQWRSDLALDRNWGVGERSPWRTARIRLVAQNVADGRLWDQCGLPQPGRTLRLGMDLR